MTAYTVDIVYSGGPKNQFLNFYYNNSSTGVGTSSSNPLDLNAGDTVTFDATDASGPGYVTVSGLNIFTDNSNFSIAWPNYTGSFPVSVTRTVAGGNNAADTVTATHSGAGASSDFFYFERQIDDTPDGFVSGNWAGAATSFNTFYYASFDSNVTASTTSVGTYTVAGLSTGASVPISLALTSGFTATDADFSVNGATWYGPGTTGINVSNGNVIRWRVKSSSNSLTWASYTLTIGSVSKDLRIRTVADRTPDDFSFPTKTDVNLNSTITSDFDVITGIDNGTEVSVSNGEVQVGTNTWWGSLIPTTINNNQTIRLRHTSSSSNSTDTTTSVTVGTLTRTFTSTTIGVSSPVVNNSQPGASSNVTTFAPSFTHEIDLSQQGQGGTLEYNITIGDSSGGVASTTTPTTGWSTSPYVTVYRGRRHNFWARRSPTLVDRTDINIYVPYIYGGGAFTISPSNVDVTSSTSSATFTINYTSGTNLSSNHIIELIVDGTSTVLGQRTGAGSITVNSSTTGWPSEGNTTSFTGWTRLPTSLGGNNTLYPNNSATATISFAADTTPTNPVLKKSDGTTSSSEANASTSTYYYRKFTTDSVTAGSNITWNASGEALLAVSQYGTYSSSITRQLNQTGWIRIQSSSNAGTTFTGTVSHTTGASATFTVTTAGSPPGDDISGGGGTSDYGLLINNSSGTEILGPTHRALGLIYSAATGIITTGNSATLSAPGMTADNASEVVIVLPASFSASISNNITFTRGSNQFTLTNNSGSTVNTTYYIVRA